MDEEVWLRRCNREKTARLKAEEFLESKSRELFLANQQLTQMADAWRFESTKNQAILDNAAEGIVTFDEAGKITTFNRAAEEIFAIPGVEAKQKRFDELFEDFDAGEDFDIEQYVDVNVLPEFHAVADDRELVLDVALSRTNSSDERNYIAVIHDRTIKRSMEAQLALAHKMESVGQLAAGIAHEINTPIQYVGDNTRFLQDAFDDLSGLLELYASLAKNVESGADTQEIREQIQQNLEDIDIEFLEEEIPQAAEQALVGTDRVAKIVQAMREFSHPGGDDPIAVDINHTLETALTVSRNEWKYVAKSETDFSNELPEVVCFPGDLNQAFLNLIVNAAHAIDQRRKELSEPDFVGRIRITTRPAKNHVEIIFSDNGCGMSDEVKNKIFDPFYTTKPVGQGTGQGLTITQKFIVEKHNGIIEVDSTPGEGTDILLRLPLEAQSSNSSARK